jgi:exodeoxyribonuclease V alpha subunit
VQVASELLQVDDVLVEELLLDMCDDEALIQIDGTDDWVGIPDHLEMETYIAKRLRALSERPLHPLPSDEELDFARHVLELELDPQQCAAIATAVQHPVAVITGGPGTGKTTILRGALSLMQRRGLKVGLAAPTGRAARRLTETTGAKARTIHRLLEFSPQKEGFVRCEENPLAEDVIIIDEVSMVDVPLMASVCAALKPSASLLLVGDADQLPSVGPGLVFHDILNSDSIPVARLDQIYRQAENSLIVQNAHRILSGKIPLPPREDVADPDFFVIQLERPADILAAVEAMIARRIPQKFGLDPVYDIQILVPMHRGDLGAQVLNERIQSLLNPHGTSFPGKPGLRVGDRVIQTKNDYELDVANGDVGILLGPGPEDGSILVRFGDRDLCFPKERTDSLKLAYALSIHKSQGSEYPAVIIPLHTQHFMMLKRNLLYTAVTRGRKLVVLVGSARAVQIATQRNDAVHRYTLLDGLLRSREVQW